jgi:carbamoyl-phosphate synthase small subunit
MIPGYLELENGEIFHGLSFGAQHSVSAEVVFNTGMVGYPENLTDPSYRGQMICCTFPSIGNYGVPPQNHSKDGNKVLKNFESSHIHAEALLVSQYSQHYSHWNANTSLGAWLVEENVPALTGIDTRALVKTVREHGTSDKLGLAATFNLLHSGAGALLGRVVVDGMAKARMVPPEDNRHLVAEVSTKHHKVFRPLPEVDKGLRIICVDLGIKLNTIRLFLDRGIEVTLVPW